MGGRWVSQGEDWLPLKYLGGIGPSLSKRDYLGNWVSFLKGREPWETPLEDSGY